MKNKFFRIGNKYVGENNKVFIIAEIGINHGGNFKKCIKIFFKHQVDEKNSFLMYREFL